jgi:predicted nuclease of restriction endonuclease-like (RecB) superfamily
MEAARKYKRGAARPLNALRHGIHLLADARSKIIEARSRAALNIHATLLGLYWDLGQGIRKAASTEKKELRADRVGSLIATLARALTRLYGRAYSEEDLRRMLRFAECFPSPQSRDSLAGLRWSHVVPLLALTDARERTYYVTECRKHAWSPARLREQIRAMAHAHPEWSREPARSAAGKALPVTGETAMDSLLDPDFMDFVGHAGGHPGDQRGALIQAMEEHILGLDAGYCLVERRKRFQVGPDDFYLDLVLYNRRLRCLFALVFDFSPRPAGGKEPKDLMDFYLTWLNLHERQPGENPPVGIVMDANAPGDRLGLRHLESESARVAWYQTALPPRTVLHQFFLQTVRATRDGGEITAGH